ncbi:hypothetical protein RF11_13851 [Thelohanellus kitauei]|uniref:Uncharacterized protein n=1 Tax=Thelohanellus kitauei TaxID=669202 RepID=A0A0C2N015_THEKT|nr:hypothetical protein RF11_13851 [Thelohanellus kitauei]
MTMVGIFYFDPIKNCVFCTISLATRVVEDFSKLFKGLLRLGTSKHTPWFGASFKEGSNSSVRSLFQYKGEFGGITNGSGKKEKFMSWVGTQTFELLGTIKPDFTDIIL